LEPTADFHRPIAYALARAGFEVHLASSLACARVRDALFNSWDKNDRKDARVIVHLLAQGLTEPFHDPLLAGYLDIQELANTYYQISQARTRCRHGLINHYLALFFPELERFFFSSSTRSKWFCRVLQAFPTPGTITALSREAFIEQGWSLLASKVPKERLLGEIYDAASQSVGLPVAPNGLAVAAFRLQLQRFFDLTEQRDQLEKQAGGALDDHPDFRILRTLPGFGPIIALTILAESGDLRRFRHHRQYLKFCGFNLATVQSGNRRGEQHLAKRGNARLRAAYWLAATVAIRQRENSFRAKYDRYIAADPTNRDLRRKAHTAVAVKLARVAHALVKQGTEYRGHHEVALPGGGTSCNRVVGPAGIP
jgi:transposase